MELAQQDFKIVATKEKNVRAALTLGKLLDPRSDMSIKAAATDMAEAEHWYLVAARSGLPSAQVALALFLIGNGINKSSDGTEPIEWLSRAAKAGAGDAQGLLSDILADSNAGHSPILAYAWAFVADRNGDSSVLQYRHIDERGLSSGDIAQAKEIANELYSLLPQKNCRSIE
jgi:TPR repeat protein